VFTRKRFMFYPVLIGKSVLKYTWGLWMEDELQDMFGLQLPESYYLRFYLSVLRTFYTAITVPTNKWLMI